MSRAGARRPRIYAAAATRGSFPTRRSRAAKRTGRIRRRFRRVSRNCACGSTGSIGSRTVVDPFLGLGSTAVACAQLGLDFVGIEMDEGYLKEAIARVKAVDQG